MTTKRLVKRSKKRNEIQAVKILKIDEVESIIFLSKK